MAGLGYLGGPVGGESFYFIIFFAFSWLVCWVCGLVEDERGVWKVEADGLSLKLGVMQYVGCRGSAMLSTTSGMTGNLARNHRIASPAAEPACFVRAWARWTRRTGRSSRYLNVILIAERDMNFLGPFLGMWNWMTGLPSPSCRVS